MIVELNPRPYMLRTDPPDTRGHMDGAYDADGRPVAVLGCNCEYCFREVVSMHERRGLFF